MEKIELLKEGDLEFILAKNIKKYFL